MLSTKGAAGIRSNEIGTYSYAKTSNHSMAFAAHSSERTPEAQDVRPVIDAIPTLAWSARADGSADFLISAGSTIPASLRSKPWIGVGNLRFTPTTSQT